MGWPLLSATLAILAWAAVLISRRQNRSDRSAAFYVAIAAASGLAVASATSLFWAVSSNGIDPTHHVYSASVCVLVLWTIVHLAVGILMLLYCAARRFARRMDSVHDADIVNVTLYWHFLACYITTAIWCEKFAESADDTAPILWLIVPYTLLAAVVICVTGWLSYQDHRRGPSSIPYDRGTEEDRRGFVGFATFLLSMLSLIATLFTALVFVLVRSCD
jgi:heme/copper-type cytochrome/quinol oxidase subunit 3